MKKTLLLLVLICITLASIGQTNKYENEILTVVLKNGCNIKKEIQFELPIKIIENIKNSELFLNSEFSKIIDSTNINKPVIDFISYEIFYVVLEKRYQLVNPNSFDFIDNSIGVVYFSSEQISIKFYFKGQNKLGNYITSSANFYIYLENNNKKYLYY